MEVACLVSFSTACWTKITVWKSRPITKQCGFSSAEVLGLACLVSELNRCSNEIRTAEFAENVMQKIELHHEKTRFFSAGWSIVELLTVVVVLAAAAIFIVPYAASGASAVGQSATRLLVTDMLAAQMDAVATQGFRRVHFFSDGSGWCVLILQSNELNNPFDASNATYAADEIESQGQSQQSIVDFSDDTRFRGIEIENPEFDGGSLDVTFDPMGGIVANDGSPSLGGSVVIQSGDYSWEVTVAPLTGKVSVFETTSGGQ